MEDVDKMAKNWSNSGTYLISLMDICCFFVD